MYKKHTASVFASLGVSEMPIIEIWEVANFTSLTLERSLKVVCRFSHKNASILQKFSSKILYLVKVVMKIVLCVLSFICGRFGDLYMRWGDSMGDYGRGRTYMLVFTMDIRSVAVCL